jgi:hypothetical protein
MATPRYVIQNEVGHTLGRFETLQEVNYYIDSHMLRLVDRQRVAIPPPVEFTTPNWDYPSEMLQIDYCEVFTVRESTSQNPLDIWAEMAHRTNEILSRRWDFGLEEKPRPNNEEIEKAHKLLLECLNEQEKEELESFKTITINTKIGMFRIMTERFDSPIPPAFNAIYKGKRYCAVLKEEDENYPRADHFIAQILLIRTDPKKFLASANKE